MNYLIEYFAKQKVLPELLTVLVIGAGLISLKGIQRESFPSISYDIIAVSTFYPGASPEEVENLITSPLEQELREVEGIKKMTSVSIEGISEIVVQLDPDQVKVAEAEIDIQQVVDRFQDLPAEVEEDPIVISIESKNNPVIEVTLSTDLKDVKLKKAARFLEKELEKIPQSSGVDISGTTNYEYRVELRLKDLQDKQISVSEILQQLKNENVTIPAGDYTFLKDGIESEMVIRTTGQYKTPEDIERVVLRANDLGEPLLIKDVADVSFTLAEPAVMYKAYGKKALRLLVRKKETSDAIKLVDRVKEKLLVIKDHPMMAGVRAEYVNDNSERVRNRIRTLSSNLFIGLVLVLIVLGVFLPLRMALIVSVGIPFSFLATIWALGYFGITLNLLTMMGLIIVVGMLVDDAVVVAENAFQHIEKGLSPLEGAIKGTQEIWLAVFASVLTTILAFFPMVLMTGIFGKFVSFIPIAVIIALVMSLIEAYFVMPSHIALWGRPLDVSKQPKFKKAFEARWKRFNEGYIKILRRVISAPYRYLVVVGFLFIVVGTVMVSKNTLKFILFPPDGVETFIIKGTAPRGSSLDQSKALMEPLEQIVSELPENELMNYVMTVGEHKTRADGADTKRGTHYAQLTVYLTPENQRGRDANEVIEELKQKIGQPENLDVIFTRKIPGPPVGSPISVGVRGENMDEIESALKDLYEEVVKWEGVKDINYNYTLGKEENVIRLNPVETYLAGLSVAEVGQSVRVFFEGVVPTTVKQLEDEIDVRVTLKKEEKTGSVLEEVTVLNRANQRVSLKQIATIEESVGVETIYHEANQRQFSLLGDVDTKITSSGEVVQRIKDWLPNISDKYPDLTFTFGGEEEDTNESLASLKRTFLLAVCLIYILLVLTFGNFYQPLLILSAIPLGITAVLWTLMLHGKPISFMATLGIIALAGIIVNNAIVYIDFVNKALKEGMDVMDAVIDAGRIRLRPIVLTTSTTVCGLLPTAYGLGGVDKFVMPVSLSLGWGLLFGSLMTSFFIPALVTAAEAHRVGMNRAVALLGLLITSLFFYSLILL